ncbi:RNA-dependent RNA polymerase [viral metagenome]|uniref:RNA-dependent RNA polymerase n=1 Tax=viral metagenome TaxID=1070528 RepID=A0A6L2ZJ57_9ZZZZ
MQNLSYIGKKPSLGLPIHGKKSSPDDTITPAMNRIIDTALYKFLTQPEAHKVIHGYRRSVWNEDALNTDIERLNSIEKLVPKDDHYWNAINHIKKMLQPEVPLQPVHFADLPVYPWRLSTNIGAPFAQSPKWQNYVKSKYNYFAHGTPFENFEERDLFVEAHANSQPLEIKDTRMTKHNLYTEAFFITRKNIHLIKEGKKTNAKGHDLKYWNTAFARQHLVEVDQPDKVRLVFGAPFTLLCSELMFFWPIQIFLLTMTGSKSFMLWGFETILGGWFRLLTFFYNFALRHTTVVTLDWRGFDRDARHTVISDIHTHVLRPMFDFSRGYHPTVTNPSHVNKEDDLTYTQKLDNLWNWMTNSVLSIPLMMPDGTMIQFNHSGIFSGYFQTQILDSIYNLVMIFTILSKMGFDLDKVVIKVQGDDSIFMLLCVFAIISSSFMSLFQHYATYYFGSTVSVDKSEIRDSLQHAEVLKYRNNNGIPYRDELQLLAQLRHPERSTLPRDVAARCIGIAYASCGQLPRTYQICEDIFNYLSSHYEFEPRESEIKRMFQHLEFADIEFDASKFPSFFEVTRHLTDGHTPLTSKHWPLDYFIGLPGRR